MAMQNRTLGGLGVGLTFPNRNVAFLEASIRTLSVCMISIGRSRVLLSRQRVSGVEAGFQLPISSGGLLPRANFQSVGGKGELS